MDDPPNETNRLRTLLTACLVLLLVAGGVGMAVTPAMAQATKSWCFDEPYENEWENITIDDINVFERSDDRSTCEDQSLKITKNENGHARFETKERGVVGDEFNISMDLYSVDDGNAAQRNQVFLVITDGSETIQAEWDAGDSKVEISGTLANETTTHSRAIEDTDLDQWNDVKLAVNATHIRLIYTVDTEGTPSEVADINTELNGSWNNAGNTHVEIDDRSFTGANDLTIYFDDIRISDYEGPNPDETASRELELNVEEYQQHGTSQPYEVRLITNETDVQDVTSSATVTSSNASVLLVDTTSKELVATNDENVSERVTITANYTDVDGVEHTVSENVTVAQATMKNFDILPSSWRINALFGFDMGSGDQRQDTLPLFILIATFAGGITARVVSSFAGIGAMLLIIIVGWFGGWVGDGVVLSALFVGLFIGFNLAANIDYSVRRG